MVGEEWRVCVCLRRMTVLEVERTVYNGGVDDKCKGDRVANAVICIDLSSSTSW